MEKKRPIGVMVFGWLFIIIGSISIIISLSSHYLDYSQRLYDLVFYPSLIISGIGLIKLKNWARILSIVQFVFSLFCLIYRVYFGILCRLRGDTKCSFEWQTDWPYTMLSLFPILFIYYLTHPKVKEQFR